MSSDFDGGTSYLSMGCLKYVLLILLAFVLFSALGGRLKIGDKFVNIDVFPELKFEYKKKEGIK